MEGLSKTAAIVAQVRQGAGDDPPPIMDDEEKNGHPPSQEIPGPTV